MPRKSSSESSTRAKPKGMLAGVTAYIDVHCDDGSDASNGVAKRLRKAGARVASRFQPSTVTHLIWSNGDPSKVYQSWQNEISVVTPLWVNECISQGLRVAEENFLVDLSHAEVADPGAEKKAKASRGKSLEELRSPTSPFFSSSQRIRAGEPSVQRISVKNQKSSENKSSKQPKRTKANSVVTSFDFDEELEQSQSSSIPSPSEASQSRVRNWKGKSYQSRGRVSTLSLSSMSPILGVSSQKSPALQGGSTDPSPLNSTVLEDDATVIQEESTLIHEDEDGGKEPAVKGQEPEVKIIKSPWQCQECKHINTRTALVCEACSAIADREDDALAEEKQEEIVSGSRKQSLKERGKVCSAAMALDMEADKENSNPSNLVAEAKEKQGRASAKKASAKRAALQKRNAEPGLNQANIRVSSPAVVGKKRSATDEAISQDNTKKSPTKLLKPSNPEQPAESKAEVPQRKLARKRAVKNQGKDKKREPTAPENSQVHLNPDSSANSKEGAAKKKSAPLKAKPVKKQRPLTKKKAPTKPATKPAKKSKDSVNDLAPTGRVVVALSGLDGEARLMAAEIVRAVNSASKGARVTLTAAGAAPWTPCTHVLVGDGDTGAKRTLRVLFALAAGTPIVSFPWLYASLEAGKWLSPAAHMAPRYAGAAGRGCAHLLSGQRVHLEGMEEGMARLVAAAGGKVCAGVRGADLVLVGDAAAGTAWYLGQARAGGAVTAELLRLGRARRVLARDWLCDSVEAGAALEGRGPYAIGAEEDEEGEGGGKAGGGASCSPGY